jgi:hypothetical protein
MTINRHPITTFQSISSVSRRIRKLKVIEKRGLEPMRAETTETSPAERALNILSQPRLTMIPEDMKYFMLSL